MPGIDLSRPLRRLAAAALALPFLAAGPAAAQTSAADDYVLLAALADRGSACGLIEDWEAGIIRAESRRLLAGIEPGSQSDLFARAFAAGTALSCEDPSMSAWFAQTREGIAQEWLPPYLALYRALADTETPVEVFLATALPADLPTSIAAIDDQIARWTAAGVTPEGNANWEDFLAEVGTVSGAMTEAIAGGESPFSADQAAALAAEAGLIGRLWLATVMR